MRPRPPGENTKGQNLSSKTLHTSSSQLLPPSQLPRFSWGLVSAVTPSCLFNTITLVFLYQFVVNSEVSVAGHHHPVFWLHSQHWLNSKRFTWFKCKMCCCDRLEYCNWKAQELSPFFAPFLCRFFPTRKTNLLYFMQKGYSLALLLPECNL